MFVVILGDSDKTKQYQDMFLVSLVKNMLEVYTIPTYLSMNTHNNKNNNDEGDENDEGDRDSNISSARHPSKISLIDMHGHRYIFFA